MRSVSLKFKAAAVLLLMSFNSWSVNLDKHDVYYQVRYSYKNNKIDYNAVCSNYKRGSVENRGCRRQAQHYFRDQCHKYGSFDIEKTRHNLTKKKMYCLAKSQFNPIR